MTDERVVGLLDDLYRDDAPEPDWDDVVSRAAPSAVRTLAGRPWRGRQRLMPATRPRAVALACACLLVVVGVASAAVISLRPTFSLQDPRSCVKTWNQSSAPAMRSSVVELQPIAAVVVGTGVLSPGTSSRCALLLMKPNGTWYATETATDGVAAWPPLQRLRGDIAAQYITAGKPMSVIVTLSAAGELSG